MRIFAEKFNNENNMKITVHRKREISLFDMRRKINKYRYYGKELIATRNDCGSLQLWKHLNPTIHSILMRY